MIIQWMIHQDIDARDTLVFPDITPVLFDKDLFPGKSDKIKRTQYRFLWHGKPADAIYRIYQIIEKYPSVSTAFFIKITFMFASDPRS